ncbi:MAG: hypothetical protein ACYC6Y_23580 [Thermoguttaceae bacterium]
MSEPTIVEDDFTLQFVSARLAGFRVPREPFVPNGDWKLDYGVYTFAALNQQAVPGGLAGHLTLARTTTDEGGADLVVEYEKSGPGSTHKVSGTIRCTTDALSTPVRWEYSVRVVDAAGKAFENSRIAKRAQAAGGRVEVSDDCGTRRLPVDGPFTINWALFDAVMRMPRQKAEPVRFTMLDHFDQVKRGQTIAYRKSSVATLGQAQVREQAPQHSTMPGAGPTRSVVTAGEKITLHAFEQLGEGIVPWVYWTDDLGRLLLVVAGLEVYVLDSWQKG